MQKNDPIVQGVVLGLDVGNARIGVARAHTIARLPEPLEVIDRKKIEAIARIKLLVAEHGVDAFVIGLPAYKSGTEGEQAQAVREFAKALLAAVPLPQIFVDESYTSQEADSYLRAKQWQGQTSNDALAACLILDRYFTEAAHV